MGVERRLQANPTPTTRRQPTQASLALQDGLLLYVLLSEVDIETINRPVAVDRDSYFCFLPCSRLMADQECRAGGQTFGELSLTGFSDGQTF